MRIVIDLQACQTESRNRGIGRYSLALAKAIALQQGQHELRFVLNNTLGERIEEVREQFTGLIDPAMFSYYTYPDFEKSLEFSNNYQRPVAGALVRNHYAQLRPDVLHISSVCEGWFFKSAVPGCLSNLPGTICSATLYDIIPLLMSDWYMSTDAVKTFYYQKFRVIKECDLLLAISEASRQDAIDHLGILPERIVNISGAAAAHFRRLEFSPEEAQTFLKRYGLKEKFLLYTGGTDYRKNLAGAISGYARLPVEVRRQCQFAVVCSISSLHEKSLLQHAANEGLTDGEVVFTGFVPETDLIHFYNLCTLFIFPTLYEGFGLPVLEAMACGAPVLGADNSSIPEIIGRRDALFDAQSPEAIAQALYRGLTDENYRADLQSWSYDRAKTFTWQRSASKALGAFEEARKRNRTREAMITARYLPRRRMAFFSPLPSRKSTIAEYTAELLPNLARYYDIDLFSDVLSSTDQFIASNFRIFSYQEFDARSNDYDIILYHLGKSACHAYMYELLQRHPGIVVLHDFFIGELLQYIAATNPGKIGFLKEELEYSHGSGVCWLSEQPEGLAKTILEYPCNRRVLDAATGIIVHSQDMVKLAGKFYPQGIAAGFTYIAAGQHPNRIAAEYAVVIEQHTQQYVTQQPSVLAAELGEILAPYNFPGGELAVIAECAVSNTPNFRPPRILIDTSHILQVGYRGGIQRVVRNITEQLCRKTTSQWQAVPVCLKKGKLHQNQTVIHKTIEPVLQEEEVQPRWHDILFMLDAPWAYYDDFKHVFTQVRQKRGSIYMIVYDLLCVLYPHFFNAHAPRIFSRWLAAGMQDSDGLICISKAVADELVAYILENNLPHRKNLKIGYFHLGADIPVITSPTAICPQVLEWFNGQSHDNVFLIVGTIAQRKGHEFALDVFEKLWAGGADVKLVMAGKNWDCDKFIKRVLDHEEYEKRLLWLDNPTDAEVIHCYRHAAALLFPSAAEGFGLPLVEAAQYGLPIICNDIPVFREVAGEFATYFSLETPQQLVDILSAWRQTPAHPNSAHMPRLSWGQSADKLIDILFHNNWYKILP